MKVRIAVAVNSVGGWAAVGAYGMADDTAQASTTNAVTDTGTGSTLVSWIEADVPQPAQPAVIQGEVVP